MKNKGCNLALARRIRDAGVPIYISEDDGGAPQDPASGLLVYQFGGVTESRAFDFHGSAGYILHVAITINLPQFAIAGFKLEPPWKTAVRWLEDPLEIDGRSLFYRFPGDEPLEFERSDVLNHRVDIRRVLSRGDSLKGSLVGIGDQPIPDHFLHGMMIPSMLIICDQFWREYRSSVSLWTDRTEKSIRSARSGMRRKRNLLDHPDRGFEHTPLVDEDEAKK